MRAEELHWFKSSYSGNEPGDACVEVAWTKSSHSGGAPGDECVEVAWSKSSHSDNEGGECVEVARCCGSVHVRDSKNKSGGQLALSGEQWAAFVSAATVGSWT
ncbi:DUF397 domain-containing protein [Streptomyces sp. NBC_01803]|uniref:DUF397 domain-containing protein n=1 Tax=Streptomyces sp. NBC_01803 TaxID=2975946 RepID=UPI002DD861FC|nr:DUF397 domain-containing protein [Streptomyces sp. NBC_01803]WSA46735.1 DUF397 domain-containing protein [Streptomyces sp. NBC_01803]